MFGEDEGFWRGIGAPLFPAPEVGRQFLGDMNHPETPTGFAPRADLAHVGGFAHAHGGFCEVEAFPSEREQFAGTEGIRHVEFQEDPVPKIQTGKRLSELFPAQRCFVGLA